MAEVTPALSSKKPPTFNYPSSSKHLYDEVFASLPLRNPKPSVFCSDDYGQIFGSSKSIDGSWLAASSSVPILELSPQGCRPSREIEYCGVFGGFGDENLGGVPDVKDLFDQLKKKAKTDSSSADLRMQRSEAQTPEFPISHISRHSDWGRAQSNEICKSFDNVEHLKHKDSGITAVGVTCTTHVHDTSGSTCQLDEGVSSQKSQTGKSPVINHETELGTDVSLKKKQEKYSRKGAVDMVADELNSVRNNCSQRASEFHDTYHENAEDMPSKIVEDDAKVGFDVKSNASLAGISNLGVNTMNNEHDAGVPVASSHETSQVEGCSNMIVAEANIDKIAPGSNVGKKKWRHSRMNSLNFGDHRESRNDDIGLHRKSRLGISYSFDASHDPFSARIRVQSSKAVPSSSVPQFFPLESHCKILENASCESSANNPYSFEEQLDMSSDAAVSVAALQRALHEAEMKFRLAKQFLEREGQTSTKWSFKDTLKAKVAKENKHVNDLDEFQPLSFTGALKEKVVKYSKPRNDAEEFRLQKIHEDRVEVHSTTRSSHLEIQNVDISVQFTPVFHGQNEDAKDKEDAKVSKLIDEGDEREGVGEWEAAKPLNQLISGMKNRIASFMTWRAETEKKGDSQEIESTRKYLHPSEEIQQNMKDFGVSEMKEAEYNRCSSISGSDSDDEENEGLIQAASVAKGVESTSCITLKEDEAGGNVYLVPASKGSTGESVLHFTFMGESSHNLSAHEGEKKETHVNRKLEFEKRQEPLLNEAKNEQIQGNFEEANWEALDGSCGSCIKESDVMVEVDYNRAQLEIKELIQQESYRKLNEQHVEEPTDISDRPEDTIDRNEVDIELEEYGLEKNAEDMQGELPACISDRPDDSMGKNERDIELEEYELEKEAEDLQGELPVGISYCPKNVTEKTANDIMWEEQVLKEAEVRQDNIQLAEETNHVGEIGKGAEVPREIYERQESERIQRDQGMSTLVKNVTGEMPKWGENNSQSQTNHTADVAENLRFNAADADCRQTEKVFLPDEEACQIDWGNPGMEGAIFFDEESDSIQEIHSCEPKMDTESPIHPDQESEKMMEMSNPSVGPKMDVVNLILTQKGNTLIGQESVSAPVSTSINVQSVGNGCQDCTNESSCEETSVPQTSGIDANYLQKGISGEQIESKAEKILHNHTDHLHPYGKELNLEEVASVSGQEEKFSVDAGHRRRRWFENGDKVGTAVRPSILNLEIVQEVLEECYLVENVRNNAIKIDDKTTEISKEEGDPSMNMEDHKVNVQPPQKRRRWFVNKGEGVPEPPNLFESTTVTLDVDPEIVNESLPDEMSDNCVDKLPNECVDSDTLVEADVIKVLKDMRSNEAAPRRKRWFENGEKAIPAKQISIDEDMTTEGTNPEPNTSGDKQDSGNLGSTLSLEEKDGTEKVEPVNEHADLDAVNRKEKERAKERIAVERAMREARVRAFAEARERVRRDTVDRPNTEPHQRAGSMAQDRTGSGKAFAEASSSSDRASMEAKLRTERAAVERATAEARERLMQKALSEKASHNSKEAGRPVEKNSSLDPKFHSSGSYSRNSHSSEKFDGAEAESPQRNKARLERQNRTMERAAKALEEKNKRDSLAQKEQAARNILADSLDVEVKQWSFGKEGNLRALLSTLQHILGPESGWQAVSLTDLMAPTAVRKAYKKANLCVHPDKLQQRSASVQQKYICEKVFDLLKEAWSKFNPDER